jgi:hypothetical protein
MTKKGESMKRTKEGNQMREISVKTLRMALLVVLGLCGPVAMASNSCDTLLTYGSGATAMNVCISNEGNIVKFESPAGFDQIGQLNLYRDGYAICSGNLPTFPNVPQGYDPGDVSVEAGFGPATVIQPNGANTLPLTIIRNSTSGNYQLTQSFARETLHRAVIITMKIKRLANGDCTSAGCPPVRLQRAFEGDVDNNTVANAAFGRSVDSVWEWIDPGSSDSNLTTGHGLHLSNVANGGATPITTVYTVADYGSYADQGCIVFAGQVTTPTDPTVTNATNLVGRLMYFFGNIPLNVTKTVKVVYERF